MRGDVRSIAKARGNALEREESVARREVSGEEDWWHWWQGGVEREHSQCTAAPSARGMPLVITSALPSSRRALTSAGLFLNLAQWRSRPLELPKKKPLDWNAVEKRLVSVLGNGEPIPSNGQGKLKPIVAEEKMQVFEQEKRRPSDGEEMKILSFSPMNEHRRRGIAKLIEWKLEILSDSED